MHLRQPSGCLLCRTKYVFADRLRLRNGVCSRNAESGGVDRAAIQTGMQSFKQSNLDDDATTVGIGVDGLSARRLTRHWRFQSISKGLRTGRLR